MYSENFEKSELNSDVQYGWPTSITFSSLIKGLSEKGIEPYNLCWSYLNEDLIASKMYNLKENKILENQHISTLDALCFLGFGKISDIRNSDKKITQTIQNLHDYQDLPTINPTKTILRARQNKKKYLIDLFKNNISIPETHLAKSIEEVSNISKELITKYGKYVTKPINGFGGFGVELFPGGDHKTIEEILQKDSEILVQEFIKDIYEYGERSLFLFDNQIEYAILKKSNNFITNVTSYQDKIKRSIIKPTKEEERLAFEAKEFVAPEALITRIDLIGKRDKPLVGEVTLSSIGLHSMVFKDKENIPSKAYWKLIKKLTK
jgi:glutathione synthase/RimK-type ligase-like ATP-grasp enzyme